MVTLVLPNVSHLMAHMKIKFLRRVGRTAERPGGQPGDQPSTQSLDSYLGAQELGGEIVLANLKCTYTTSVFPEH